MTLGSDPLAPARGLVIGLILGVLLWVLIILGVLWVFR